MTGFSWTRFFLSMYVLGLSAGAMKRSYRFALKESNMILMGHTVAEELNVSMLQCATMCIANLDCLSLNYYKLEKKCEMNSAGADQFPEDLVPRENVNYFYEIDGKLKLRQSPSTDATTTASTAQPTTTITTTQPTTTTTSTTQPTTTASTTTRPTTAIATTTQPTTTIATTTQSTTTVTSTTQPTTTAITTAQPTTTVATTTPTTTEPTTTIPATTQLTTTATTTQPTTTVATTQSTTTQSATTAIEYPADVVMQSRSSGSLDFSRSWKEYVVGFSDDSESWIGLEYVYQMTSKIKCGLLIEIVDILGFSYYATYLSFQVGSAETDYHINIADYAGTAGDASASLNGLSFSTEDKDHSSTGSLMSTLRGGWWVDSVGYTNLNGVYQPSGESPGTGEGIFWIFAPSGTKTSFVKSRMTIKQLSSYPTNADLAPTSGREPAGDSDAAALAG